ncbi:LADA_0H10220g1_1 [Lachancea dasiensis]|uniref:Alpha-1,3/1,6-mannosyltransferase ALG2 n=1 Tax=Lachancea dasiensis TaxID=1072105 RepID=A0A1G4K3C0_9SACH|nr:LADA_0H10220g1_1 [Lachancea dasiensis]
MVPIATKSPSSHEKLRIAFIHPDLGIGGAERLVVDAAIGLQDEGHEVVIYSSHCDKTHCFEEVKTGRLKVEVLGDFWPTSFNGKFFILFANLRQLYLTAALAATGKIKRHDLYIVDQLSTCVPFLGLLSRASKVLFYCHFPDQLLAQRTSLVKRLYRIPFDVLEQLTMNAADRIVVNSNFTKSIYHKTFRLMAQVPNVVYPCVGLEVSEASKLDAERFDAIISPNTKFYLSVNRYERKKNVGLAIRAFAQSSQSSRENIKLVIVGGYDARVWENKIYLEELENLAQSLKLPFATLHYATWGKELAPLAPEIQSAKIIFLTSVSSSFKDLLLQKTEMLLYTPSYEHFGIVPLEAMKLGKPVLAVNNGGPLETVVAVSESSPNDECTGWLKPSDPAEWATAIEESGPVLEKSPTVFEKSGPKRVRELFSREAMTAQCEKNIASLSWDSMSRPLSFHIFFCCLSLLVALPVALVAGFHSWSFRLISFGLFALMRDFSSFGCILIIVIAACLQAKSSLRL